MGHARLTHGYPAITATIVNTKVPVTSYANWFSYQTADFISQNKEVEQAFETTCWLYLVEIYVLWVIPDWMTEMFAQVGNWGRNLLFGSAT